MQAQGKHHHLLILHDNRQPSLIVPRYRNVVVQLGPVCSEADQRHRALVGGVGM